METTLFTININGMSYTIQTCSTLPKLYNVTCETAYHKIGKTDAGLWVYVDNSTVNAHMPLQEIGKAIEEYAGLDND